MTLTILLAFQTSNRLTREARFYRRALRDHLRQETTRLRDLEIRSRGLRLYTAWASGASHVIQTPTEKWYQATLAKATRGVSI